MEQEFNALLEKGAIEYVPHSNRETGFYSRYYIVPKKDVGLHPILELRVPNDTVIQLKAQVQNVKFETDRATDQIQGLVCHDRSQGRILPHIHPSVSQEIPEVRFWGQSIAMLGSSVRPSIITLHFHEMRRCSRIMNYIDDWLILAQSHQLAVWHRDDVLAHMKELGLRLNAKKSVLSPPQRTTFLGMVWDSTSMQARLLSARIKSILSALKRIRLGQSLTVKQFQSLFHHLFLM